MQRYEREIDELLERLETEQPQGQPQTVRRERPPQLPRRRRTSVFSAVRGAIARYTPTAGQLMAIGIGLVLLAWLLPLGALGAWFRTLGVLLFLGALVVGFLRGGSGGRQDMKMWRGRPIDEPSPSWDELRTRMADTTRDFRRRFRRRP